MLAQIGRFAIGIAFAALGIFAWLRLGGGWGSWIALVVIFVLGGILAEWTFHKTATPDEIRDDLEDRVRNPPL
jgi:O-antigen ligase